MVLKRKKKQFAVLLIMTVIVNLLEAGEDLLLKIKCQIT